eukprot:5031096-Amphidinium_carterae.2
MSSRGCRNKTQAAKPLCRGKCLLQASLFIVALTPYRNSYQKKIHSALKAIPLTGISGDAAKPNLSA